MRPAGARKAILLAILIALLASPGALGADEAKVKAPAKAPPGKLKLLGVGFATEGAFIIVNFTGSAAESRRLMQGTVSVKDEATGAVYSSVPSMPRIGPLIGHTRSDSQVGYVMLINPRDKPLQPGARVTVVLGTLKVEHVTVGGGTSKAAPPAGKEKK